MRTLLICLVCLIGCRKSIESNVEQATAKQPQKSDEMVVDQKLSELQEVVQAQKEEVADYDTKLKKWQKQVQQLREIEELKYNVPSKKMKVEFHREFQRLVVNIDDKTPISKEHAAYLIHPFLMANEEYTGLEIFSEQNLRDLLARIETGVKTATNGTHFEEEFVIDDIKISLRINAATATVGAYLIVRPMFPE